MSTKLKYTPYQSYQKQRGGSKKKSVTNSDFARVQPDIIVELPTPNVSSIDEIQDKLEFNVYKNNRATKWQQYHERIDSIKSRQDKIYSDNPKLYGLAGKLNHPYTFSNKYFEERFNAEHVTNAWIKLVHILALFRDDIFGPALEDTANSKCRFRTMSFCEMPGAWLFAMNHYITTVVNNKANNKFNKSNKKCKQLQWQWTAQSLRDDMAQDGTMLGDRYDILGKFETNFDFGPSSGDLTNPTNVSYYAKDSNIVRRIDLVTADCGIAIGSDYSRQEELNWPVLFGQIVSGLGVLDIGGAMIYKTYDVSCRAGISMVWLLSILFKKTVLCKPNSSRNRNSEVYVCAFGLKEHVSTDLIDHLNGALESDFDGDDFGAFSLTSFLDWSVVAKDKKWTRQLLEFNTSLADQQEIAIDDLLTIYRSLESAADQKTVKDIYKIRQEIAEQQFVELTELGRLDDRDKMT